MSQASGSPEARSSDRPAPARSSEQFFTRLLGFAAAAAFAFGLMEGGYGWVTGNRPLMIDGGMVIVLAGLMLGCRWWAQQRTTPQAATALVLAVCAWTVLDVWAAPETHRSLVFIVLAAVMASLPHLEGLQSKVGMVAAVLAILFVEVTGLALGTRLNLGTGGLILLTVLAIGIPLVLVLVLLAHQLELLRQRERDLQGSIRVRDEFLGLASHELRTPITAIKLALQVYRQRVVRKASPDPALLSATFDRVERQTDLLASQVDRLLDVSRISGGQLDLQPQEVDLGELTRRAVHELAFQFPALRTLVRFQNSGDSQGFWDPFWLEHVVQNLLTNALRYGEGREVELTVQGAEDLVELRVRDSGLGIAAVDLERIFERFERAVPSRHYGGFGIGLWLIRTVVTAHGGEISVTSEPGQGSEFLVRLPRADLRDRSRS